MSRLSLSSPEPLRFRRPYMRTFDQDEAQAAVAHYMAMPLNEDALADSSTLQRRQRMWANWVRFSERVGCSAQEPWIQLCKGQERCKGLFQAFLKTYISESKAERVCLGPEEYEVVQTIKSGTSAQDAWSFLVREADHQVMEPLRTRFPSQAAFWTVKYHSGKQQRGCSLAYKIGRWINELCDELNLRKSQGFEKRPATPGNLITLFDTMWTRAKDIPCTPQNRLYWHAAALIAGTTGTRPSSFVRIGYEDVEFRWIRDPNDKQRTWPVAHITIHHVKQKDQVQRDQRDKFRFSITLVPFKLLCLLTILTALAIKDNAFENNATSCDQILQPPPMVDQASSTILRWKPNFMKRNIINISYKKFLKMWHRVHIVAGNREVHRPYEMRVGAAERLHATLTPALSSFILSQSTEVYEKSYQPIQIQHNLSRLAWGEDATQHPDLWSVMVDSFTGRDPGAPIYIKEEDLQNFANRRDLISLRKDRDAARASNNKCLIDTINGRIQYITNSLESLLLEKRRQEYFAEVDSLRFLGKSTAHLQLDEIKNPRNKMFADSSATAEKLAPLITSKEPINGLADKLVYYLTGRSLDENAGTSPATCEKPDQYREPHRCLFGCGQYKSKASLTDHVEQKHSRVFEKPFNCPECLHCGKTNLVAAGMQAWYNHIERVHGKVHTPIFRTPNAYCLLCSRNFFKRGFTIHLLKSHWKEFEKGFTCPKCDGREITSRTDWLSHVFECHGGEGVSGAVIINAVPGESAGSDSTSPAFVSPTRKRAAPTSTFLKDTTAKKRRALPEDHDDHELPTESPSTFTVRLSKRRT